MLSGNADAHRKLANVNEVLLGWGPLSLVEVRFPGPRSIVLGWGPFSWAEVRFSGLRSVVHCPRSRSVVLGRGSSSWASWGPLSWALELVYCYFTVYRYMCSPYFDCCLVITGEEDLFVFFHICQSESNVHTLTAVLLSLVRRTCLFSHLSVRIKRSVV